MKDPSIGHVKGQDTYVGGPPTTPETGSLCLAYMWLATLHHQPQMEISIVD